MEIFWLNYISNNLQNLLSHYHQDIGNELNVFVWFMYDHHISDCVDFWEIFAFWYPAYNYKIRTISFYIFWNIKISKCWYKKQLVLFWCVKHQLKGYVYWLHTNCAKYIVYEYSNFHLKRNQSSSSCHREFSAHEKLGLWLFLLLKPTHLDRNNLLSVMKPSVAWMCFVSFLVLIYFVYVPISTYYITKWKALLDPTLNVLIGVLNTTKIGTIFALCVNVLYHQFLHWFIWYAGWMDLCWILQSEI